MEMRSLSTSIRLREVIHHFFVIHVVLKAAPAGDVRKIRKEKFKGKHLAMVNQ